MDERYVNYKEAPSAQPNCSVSASFVVFFGLFKLSKPPHQKFRLRAEIGAKIES